MRPAVLALFLAAVPAASRAQEIVRSDEDGFRSLAAAVQTDPSIAGEWVILLPAIARRCRLAVDQARVTAFVDQLAHPDAVDYAADYYASHPDSRFKSSWDSIADRDQKKACRLADSLWGLHSSLTPGVLRLPTDSTGHKITQQVSGGRTR